VQLPQLDEVDALLLRVGVMVDAIEARDYEALDRVRIWLVEAAAVFERDRRGAGAATLAGLRAQLDAIALGVMPVGLSTEDVPRRRRRDAALLLLVQTAAQTVSSAVADVRARLDEAGGLMRQIVAVARHKQLAGSAAPGPGSETGLRALWAEIAADADMTGAATRVLGLANSAEALALLDQALALP
jgi:hypothetical protein